ncbi:MAG: trypco2 family protein [Bacteroidota bacterium]
MILLEEVVRDIKLALSEAQDLLINKGVVIERVDVEIKTEVVEAKDAELGFKIKCIPLSSGKSRTNSVSNTIRFSFIPEILDVVPQGAVEEALKKSIAATILGVDAGRKNYPVLDINSSMIELVFGVEESGRFTVSVFGAKYTEAELNRISIYFETKPNNPN